MHTQTTEVIKTNTARVVLKPRKALPFFSRHPWVFQGAVDYIDGEPSSGDPVALHAHDGVFIAFGLFNPASNICVRLYSWDEAVPLTDEFWRQRIDEAIGLRRVLFPSFEPTLACRLIYSEADGLSGLTVDRYGDWLLVQLTSLAMAERKDIFLDRLGKRFNRVGSGCERKREFGRRKDWNWPMACCGRELLRDHCSLKSTACDTELMWPRDRKQVSFSTSEIIEGAQPIS